MKQKEPWAGYLCAAMFVLLMTGAAVFFQDREIILPEIVAMAIALWAYREKGWMRQPDKIFIAPTATALIGFGINLLSIPYFIKAALILVMMVLFLRLIRYSLAPALATGLLPLATNATEFSFIASIVTCTFLLMAGVLLLKMNKGLERNVPVKYKYMAVFLVINFIWLLVTWLLNVPQMAVIPPVVVVVYESLNMPQYHAKMAVKQVVVLSVSAAVGTLLFLNISNWLLVACLDLAIIYLLLRVFGMRVPAAYAFPFLAFIFPREVVVMLPYTAIVVSVYYFGAVLLYKSIESRQMAAVA